MSLTALKALALAKKYTKDTIEGAGAVAGKPCQIQSITDITGGKRVTFLWVDNSSVEHTSTMDVMNGEKGDTGETGANGKGIKSASINQYDHLIITYDDDTTSDAGLIPNVQADWNEDDSSAGSFIKNKPTLGTASEKDYTDTVRPGSHDLVESNAVSNAINQALSSIYTPRGELSCAELTSELLIEENIGSVYEMSDSGTTSALFINGAGIAISANDSVGIIKAGQNTILFNYMGNAFDLHDYQKKDLTTPVVGETTVEGALGGLNTKETDDIKDVYEVMGKNGAKNLLRYPYFYTTKTTGGITFTDNGDGTITANGTATAEAVFLCSIRTDANSYTIKNGNYILSGCPDGGSTTTYFVAAAVTKNGSGVNIGNDIGSGTDIIVNGCDYYNDRAYVQVIIDIRSGTTVSNLVFKPMLRLAEDADSTYAPYSKTNRELTIDKAEQAEVNDIVNVYGSKNILRFPYSYSTKTSAGITYTVNDDGTIIANGTATDTSIFRCSIRKDATVEGDFFIPNGNYILSGCTGGTPTSPYTYDLRCVITKNSEAVALAINADGDAPFTVNGDDFSQDGANPTIQIIIRQGITVTNKVFKPMIRLASVKDSTYVPYVPTNAELHKNKVPYEVASGVQGKNLLTTPYWTGTGVKYGITFTINDDGSVTANGTADSNNNVYFNFQVNELPSSLALEEGQTYTLSGCPTGGNADTYSMIVRNVNPSTDIATDIGNGVTFKYNNTSTSTPQDKPTIAIRIIKGTTVSNLTFKPMLEIGAIAHAYDPTPSDTNYDSNAVHETITGKKWIDGKAIYRKVVDCGALPNATTKSVAHGITGYDNFVSIGGFSRIADGSTQIPLPYISPSGHNISVDIQGANVTIGTDFDRSTYTKSYVILEYTKS